MSKRIRNEMGYHYEDKQGELHREDGPALICWDAYHQEFWYNGLKFDEDVY